MRTELMAFLGWLQREAGEVRTHQLVPVSEEKETEGDLIIGSVPRDIRAILFVIQREGESLMKRRKAISEEQVKREMHLSQPVDDLQSFRKFVCEFEQLRQVKELFLLEATYRLAATSYLVCLSHGQCAPVLLSEWRIALRPIPITVHVAACPHKAV